MSKELIKKAKELGIENAETLTAAQLKKAIEAAEKKIADTAVLKERAVSLGIITAEKTDAELTEEVERLENTKSLREKAVELGVDDVESVSEENLEIIVAYIEKYKSMANEEAREAELSEMLSEFLGVDDVYSLSKEEIKDLLVQKEAEKASGVEVVVEKQHEGKTDKSFTVNGKNYAFADDAPAVFRYLGQRRTQLEWIADSDALELMVAGNLSFVKPVKK